MLLMIALVIAVLWLVGFIALPTIGALIHILLVVALIAVVLHFMGVGRTRSTV